MDDVFKALADPSRRLLLDRLHKRDGQNLSELCDCLAMARQSVSKHLAVLEAASLVVTTWRGREKVHHLNAAPIEAVAHRWISKYAQERVNALADLKIALESNVSDTQFVYTTYVRTTPERLWQALTDPVFTRRYWGVQLLSEWRKGAPVTWEENGVVIADPEQVVLESDPPRRLAYTWHTFTPQWATGVGIDDETLARLAAEPRSKVTFERRARRRPGPAHRRAQRLPARQHRARNGRARGGLACFRTSRACSRRMRCESVHAQVLFGPFGGRVSLNAAHQGPLPQPAADAPRAAIEDKLDPHRIGDEVFLAVPERLRALLARLIGARSDEVVFGQRAPAMGLTSSPTDSHFSQAMRSSIAENEFPPLCPLAAAATPRRPIPHAARARRCAIAPTTWPACCRIEHGWSCVSWVFSFSGATADVPALVEVCRTAGSAVFVLNGSQAVARPTDVRA